MDKELARHVAATAFKSAEYQTLLKAIATANAAIHLEIGNKIFGQYPELEQEFDAKIKKYGCLI